MHFTLLLHLLRVYCSGHQKKNFLQILKIKIKVKTEMCYKLNRITNLICMLITATKLRVMITLSAMKDCLEIINERWFEP